MMASGETTDSDNKCFIQLEEKNLHKQSEMLKKIYEIWNKVGVDDEQKFFRAIQVWKHVFQLLETIMDEEVSLYEDIKERVRNYEIKLSDLLAELQLPKDEEVDGSLIVREETLRKRIDELSKIIRERNRKFKSLQTEEMKYCKILGMPPLNLTSTTGVPTEKDICELQEHIKMLQEEKENRQKKFYRLKKELTTILETTELTPETPLEKELLSQEEESASLSTETFKLLEHFVTKTKNKKADLQNEKTALMQKLTGFWEILKIDEKEREKFLLQHTDCKVSTLNAIKTEIQKYEEIRRQNISKYVDGLKEELMSLWSKCFVSRSESMICRIKDDEVDEDILERYENEVSSWRKYYRDTEHIIKKIEKRQELWEQVILFENKANDPNRFKNRGGQLLQEERQRKQLQKILPELEEKILNEINKYEEETGKQFLYFGERFQDFMEKQWSERENEKLTRQKLRSKQIMNEHTLKSPAKRPFAGITPKSAPSKMFKSNVGLPIYRTPNYSVSRQIPSTIARLKNNKLSNNSACKAKRDILRERNEKSSKSNNLDSTTYTEFADQLNRSSKIAHRSSVLSSRKIVGTRISTGKTQRKSINKSGQKSIHKKGNSSKLTPARGKLGLPFLI